MKKIKRFFEHYNWKTLAIMPLYPFLMIFTNPYSFIRTIKNYNIFREKDLSFYTGATLTNALNNYAYYTQYFNIKKFGRYGHSHLLAGGSSDLRAYFNFTPLSLRMMTYFGTCMFLFICMSAWMLSTTLTVDMWTGYSFVILLAAMTSVLLYVNFFDLQNYNALGWIFLPLAVKALLAGNYLQMICLSLLMSLGSFTAVIIISFFAVLTAVFNYDLKIFLSVIPSLCVFIRPFLESLKTNGVTEISRLVGLVGKAKYKRVNNMGWILTVYHIISLWAIFAIFYYFLNGKDTAFILIVFTIVLFWANETFLRFADAQTFFIVYLSVATVVVLNARLNPLLIMAYFLSVNPIYGLLSYRPFGKLFFNPPVRKPINTKVVLDALSEFLIKLPKNSKILLSFRHPDNNHDMVFDGYRIFVEPLEYAAAQKDIAVFPDWYFISENNRFDSPEDFWGTEPPEVSRALAVYSADYSLIYQTEPVLNAKWAQNGFIPVSCLDWKQLLNKLNIGYEPQELHWWILRKQEKR